MPASILILVNLCWYHSLDILQCDWRQWESSFCHAQVFTWALNSHKIKQKFHTGS